MISFIYDVKEVYKNSKIYIWDLNKDSVEIATYALFKGVFLEGFVVSENKYNENFFVNRPIFDFGQAKGFSDGILVIANTCEKDQYIFLKDELINLEVIYEKDLYSFSEKLKEQTVFVYGVGGGARILTDLLKKENVGIEAYVETTVKQGMKYNDLPILNREELLNENNPVVVISVLNDLVQQEIVDGIISEKDIDIYISEIVDRITVQDEVILPALNEAIKQNKKIYFLGNQNAYTNLLKHYLQKYKIEVNGFFSIDEIYDSYEMGFENFFFLITYLEKEKIEQARDMLCELGFSLEKFDFSGIRIKTFTYNNFETVADCLFGYCIKGNREVNGFQIHGNESAKCRILVLGGSTSTETAYDTINWVEYLYRRLNIDESVVIYNASNCGFDVVQELLILMRDGIILKPDIVISMSGFNNSVTIKEGTLCLKLFGEGWNYENIKNEFNLRSNIILFNKYNLSRAYNAGLESEEELLHFWVRNEKILRMISESLNSIPYIFLQPMYMKNDADTLFEYNVFVTERRKKFISQYNESVPDDTYIDISNIFGVTEKMYIDEIHYSSKANRIIADRVYETIIDDVKNRSKR